MVADALSRKSSLSSLMVLPKPLKNDVCKKEIELIMGKLANMTFCSTLLEIIKDGQEVNLYLKKVKMESSSQKEKLFKKSENGIILFKDRIYVPNNKKLKKKVLLEAHETLCSLHLGIKKMYRDLKKH